MVKNLIFDLILAHLAQIWIPQIFIVNFTSASIYPLFEAIILCKLKEN